MFVICYLNLVIYYLMPSYSTRIQVIIVSAALLFIQGCSRTTNPTTPEEEKAGMDIVQPDGKLEAVTWNLEWYGSTGNGPGDDELQTDNILRVVDSLEADLYAFEEVFNQEALNKLLAGMEGYRGFVAPHIDWIQKTSFVYNTATIDSISAGGITETQGQNSYDWANGRFPLFFEFDYTYREHTTRIYSVVIHAKANTGNAEEQEESYERRKRAADSLYNYLMNRKPEARIILLGDYNDDVDRSIFNDRSTPYRSFVVAGQHFRIVTKILSESDVPSTVEYNDMIDHITVSDELFDALIEGSPESYRQVLNFIPDYGTTTSDHYPVWAKFDLSGN